MPESIPSPFLKLDYIPILGSVPALLQTNHDCESNLFELISARFSPSPTLILWGLILAVGAIRSHIAAFLGGSIHNRNNLSTGAS